MGTELPAVYELLFHIQTVLVLQMQWLSYMLVTNRWDSIEEYLTLTLHQYSSKKVTPPRKRRVVLPRMTRDATIDGIDIFDRTGVERSTFMRYSLPSKPILKSPDLASVRFVLRCPLSITF
jgi:hypothetical protein